MKTVIEMAREAGIRNCTCNGTLGCLERLIEIVRADQDEKYKWDVHSCGPTCTKAACVAIREAVQAEREACAKVCDVIAQKMDGEGEGPTGNIGWVIDCAEAIRARSNT
jgi:hypothetical protein